MTSKKKWKEPKGVTTVAGVMAAKAPGARAAAAPAPKPATKPGGKRGR
ncbi:hypothetical protein ACQ5SO_03730 [Rhodovulum sp. DZ06]